MPAPTPGSARSMISRHWMLRRTATSCDSCVHLSNRARWFTCIKKSLEKQVMTMSNTEQLIRKQISENPVLIYMKGTPDAPECGFSGAAVAALKKTGTPFAYINVLANPFIRERLPSISRWPTFPQLFVKGELIGGSDIVVAMATDGSLQPLLADAGTTAAQDA